MIFKWLPVLLFFLSVPFLSVAQSEWWITDTLYHTPPADSKIKSIVSYRITGDDSVKDGPAFYYYENGSLWQKGFHRDNELDSLWTVYFPTGRKQSIKEYDRGVKVGRFVRYYHNGNPKNEGTYDRDSLTGRLTLYNEDGGITETRDYEHNKLNGFIIGYYPDGTMSYRFQYADSVLNGIYETFYENGAA